MKKFPIFLSAGLLLAFSLGSCAPVADKPEGFGDLRKEFQSPSKEYGTAPLYVWNTRITPELIDRTMEDLKDKGFGGVFVHPRPGLITEYLSDDWFDLFRHTLDKGKELGMNVWIYDENTFPSGFAGGHVNAQMPESYNQGSSIVLYRYDAIPESLENLYLCLKETDGEFVDITQGMDAEKGNKGKYYVYLKSFEPRVAWHGGYSYVDLLYPGVTEKFLEVTGRGYERVAGDEFGRHMPGWFTDEPHIGPPGGGIRWTADLFEVFQKMWGYDLKTALPSLSLDVGDWKKVRHNYHQTLLHLFIERWAKPCFEYCDRRNLQFTGHYWEHAWPETVYGPDNMAMYAWQHMPGIDMLMNQFDETEPQAQFGNVRSVKELSSVANQMGRKRTLCETYGAAGWEETFRDFKRLGDWQTVLGVNFMNQHLSHLSIIGDRKYDCPTSFSEHSPWWPYYKTLNTHFSRLSAAMSMGQQRNDILILEPTTTIWFYYVTWDSRPKLWEIGRNFQSFVTTLEKAQAEYDLGSENIIRDHGRIRRDKLEVGKRAYSTFVIPPLVETLNESTFELLKQFVKNGGKLLTFSKPDRIDGQVSDEVIRFFNEPSNFVYLERLTGEVIASRFSSAQIQFEMSPGGNLFHNRRAMNDGQLLFMVNSSLEEAASGKVRLQGKDVVELNTMTGRMYDYPDAAEDGTLWFQYRIPPGGSLLLYVFDKKQQGYSLPVTPAAWEPVEALCPSQARPCEPNVLAIDFCDLELDGQSYKDTHVYEAARKVFAHCGFGEGNPWGTAIQYKDNIVSRDTMTTGGFKATYRFRIDTPFDLSSLKAAVERPELYTIRVNGVAVDSGSTEWWVDREIRILPVGPLLRQGINTLSIEVSPMKLHAEIAPVYILGDFRVKPADKGWAITGPAPAFDLGSWRGQGWPFYSKAVSYTKDFEIGEKQENYRVRLPRWDGTVAEVTVNGQPAGIIAFDPCELDVGRWIRPGRNRIEVKVVGSNKNLFGPFHNNSYGLGFVTPNLYKDVKIYPPGRDYQQLDYGLMEDFVLDCGRRK